MVEEIKELGLLRTQLERSCYKLNTIKKINPPAANIKSETLG
jgi:hypothetical protein